MPAPTFFNDALPVWWNGLTLALISKAPHARPTIDEVLWLFEMLRDRILPAFETWLYESELKYTFFHVYVDLLRLTFSRVGRHLETKVEEDKSGGVRKRTLRQHPTMDGNDLPEAIVKFERVFLPAGREYFLETYIGIRDGATKPYERTKDRPVRFAIKANGEVVFGTEYFENKWERLVIALDPLKYQFLDLEFITQGVKDNLSAWAAWGEPKIVVTGPPIITD